MFRMDIKLNLDVLKGTITQAKSTLTCLSNGPKAELVRVKGDQNQNEASLTWFSNGHKAGFVCVKEEPDISEAYSDVPLDTKLYLYVLKENLT